MGDNGVIVKMMEGQMFIKACMFYLNHKTKSKRRDSVMIKIRMSLNLYLFIMK